MKLLGKKKIIHKYIRKNKEFKLYVLLFSSDTNKVSSLRQRQKKK